MYPNIIAIEQLFKFLVNMIKQQLSAPTPTSCALNDQKEILEQYISLFKLLILKIIRHH